jgi:nitroreductase
MSSRTPEYAVHPQFIQRWSPRAYSGQAITQAELMSLFEAARWTPSTSNTQPWRFVYALAGSAHFEAMCQTLAPGNRLWAHRAAALIAVISATSTQASDNSETKPLLNHAFDTGAAWMALTGWTTHAMAGVDKEALRQTLGVPLAYAIHCVVAVGRQGNKAQLDEALQARETPNARQPLSAMVCEGRFGFDR